jgi:hypothetical protein
MESAQAEQLQGNGVGATDAEVAPAAPEDGKVLEGKDGWLFVANDRNDVVGQHTGHTLLTDRELRDWRLVLENRVAWLEKLGIHYFFMLSINPHTLYPEMLPDDTPMAAVRPVQQLIGHLEETGSFARVVYPLEEILARKAERPVAAKTSSHWNAVGAYGAYARLIAEIGAVVPVQVLPEERVEYFDQPRASDLGVKFQPPRRSPQTFANVTGQKAHIVSDNFIHRRGRIAEFECPGAPDTTCLLLGDSFNYQLMPYLAESVGKLVFAHLHTLDHDVVLEHRPDVVVNVMNERGLTDVMYDLPAPTTADFAAEKQARGEVDEGSGRIWRPAAGARPVDKGC